MKTVTKYLLTFGLGFALAFYIACANNIFAQTDPTRILNILSDCFYVPGVILAGVGSLIFISNEGGFDALSYGITSFIDLFRKEKKNKYKTFYDYKEEKSQKTMPMGFLLISGLVFLVLAILMLFL